MDNQSRAIALFSGGLDSILACRLVADQGVLVKAIKFVTPFFGYDLLNDASQYREKIWGKYNIDVEVRDITDPYLRMLHDPVHGFGKHFNPCIDCKILMLAEAKKIMAELGASFIITGEVIGQRPMSQRKDTLRVIERDSGTDSILLRPLCAGSQKPTRAELGGIIDRKKFPYCSGRGRARQREIAAKFGITDYPNPAGGCILTDPNLARRIKKLYSEVAAIDKEDVRFQLTGRQFRLPHGGWLTLGRDKNENAAVLRLLLPGDMVVTLHDRPGPTALLRYSSHPEDIRLAAALVVRYGKKIPGSSVTVTAKVTQDGRDIFQNALSLPDNQLVWLSMP